MATHKPVIVDELYGELALDNDSQKWQVIHTKPQCEKKLAEYLKRSLIYYYLPMLDSIRVYKYRKVTFTKPMFPGYIFARFNPSDKNTILISGKVVSFLKVPNENELLNDLNNIYLGRTHKADLTEGLWLQKGWYVEITSGSLRGIRGVVKNQSKLNEVTLQVNILRQAITMKVNPLDVKVINEYNYS